MARRDRTMRQSSGLFSSFFRPIFSRLCLETARSAKCGRKSAWNRPARRDSGEISLASSPLNGPQCHSQTNGVAPVQQNGGHMPQDVRCAQRESPRPRTCGRRKLFEPSTAGRWPPQTARLSPIGRWPPQTDRAIHCGQIATTTGRSNHSPQADHREPPESSTKADSRCREPPQP